MKFVPTTAFSGPHPELIAASEKAARSIPPLWPLAATVAVNPYLGQTDLSLAQTAAQQARVAGARVTMEPSWYLERLSSGQITDADLAAALAAGNFGDLKAPEDVRAALAEEVAAPAPLPTVADLAAEASGIDWPALIAERIGAWAAAYFDTGQALWQLAPGQGAYDNWKSFASRDLCPEIMGLKGFAARVNAAPDTAPDAMGRACEALGMSTQAAITYFQQLLAQMGGWAQLGRYKLWQAELAVSSDRTTTDLLVIALSFEAALLENYRDEIAARWQAVMDSHATPPAPTRHDLALVIAQEAAERAGQRDLAQLMAEDTPAPSGERPALQAAFCIDVRSEVYRRALESVDPAIETKGFAGFFGLAVAHQDEGSDIVEKRLPVLLNPGVESAAAVAPKADTAHRISARASRAWGRFKLAAISSFAFVEATGPVYAGKLVKDALGQRKPAGETAAAPRLDPKMTMGDKIGAAKAILGAMSLTSGFAPLVMMVGHGASVTNNPHASALHCGACGGYKGDVNARLLAQLLNDPQVRTGLAEAGIEIPADTLFLGALHDTTTDEITTFADDLPGGADLSHLKKAKGWMAQATNLTKAERALRLPGALDDAAQVSQRSRDWSEVQPEWALAGCKAFIAAPRARTKGKSLAGRAFLHDYDWRQDDGFGVLELILTAPVVVASWISLQYYGSTVAPHVYGAGNKVLHNVTGGIGVLEGNGGNLRGGLPWQSVHDGTKLAHEPLRLSVCVEAPTDAINDILDRHPGVKDLFDNGWLHLFAMDDNGTLAQRYTGDLCWAAEPAPAKAA